MGDDPTPAPFEVAQHITAHSRYYAGEAGSRFYRALRDGKIILASRCGACRRVYWPPRTTCGRCFGRISTDDMVPVGPGGTLETFTCVTYEEPVHPLAVPFVLGVVKLDGADTGMAHIIAGARPEDLAIGMRVEAVFAEERRGDILDIRWFKPVPEAPVGAGTAPGS